MYRRCAAFVFSVGVHFGAEKKVMQLRSQARVASARARRARVLLDGVPVARLGAVAVRGRGVRRNRAEAAGAHASDDPVLRDEPPARRVRVRRVSDAIDPVPRPDEIIVHDISDEQEAAQVAERHSASGRAQPVATALNGTPFEEKEREVKEPLVGSGGLAVVLSHAEKLAVQAFVRLGPAALRTVFFTELSRADQPSPLDMALALVRAGFQPPESVDAFQTRYGEMAGQLRVTESSSAAAAGDVESKTGAYAQRLRLLVAERGVTASEREISSWSTKAAQFVLRAESSYGVSARTMGVICSGRMPRIVDLIPAVSQAQQQTVAIADNMSIVIDGKSAGKAKTVHSLGDVSRALSLVEEVWSECCPFLASDVRRLRKDVVEEFDRVVSPQGLARLVFAVVDFNLTHNERLYCLTDMRLASRIQVIIAEHSIAGRCRTCGSAGHFAADCPTGDREANMAARGHVRSRFRQYDRDPNGHQPPRNRDRDRPSASAGLVEASEICKAFNSQAGCNDGSCKFAHVCSVHRRFHHSAAACRSGVGRGKP